jgi:hypothetical protein
MDLPIETRSMILRHHFPAKVAARSPPAYRETLITTVPSIFLASKQLGAEAQRVLYEDVPFAVTIDAKSVSFWDREFSILRWYGRDSLVRRGQGGCSEAFSTVARRIKNFDIIVSLGDNVYEGTLKDGFYVQDVSTSIYNFVNLVKRGLQASGATYKSVSVRLDCSCINHLETCGLYNSNIEAASWILKQLMKAFEGLLGVSDPSFDMTGVIVRQHLDANSEKLVLVTLNDLRKGWEEYRKAGLVAKKHFARGEFRTVKTRTWVQQSPVRWQRMNAYQTMRILKDTSAGLVLEYI